MMDLLLALSLAVGGLLGAVLVLAALRPGKFLVQRSASINAPAERVFSLITNLKRFNGWNPYRKKDPNLAGIYGGPESGAGAIYAFSGSRAVGRGSLQIVEAVPASRVTMSLVMVEPFAAHNVVRFTLEPRGEATTAVTWSLQGRLGYAARLAQIFFDLGGAIGRDFESGLAGLKALAEARGRPGLSA